MRYAALALLVGTAYAQTPMVWRYWTMADGLYESYASNVTNTPEGIAWACHGGVDFVSALDGYRVRQVAGSEGLDRPIFGMPGRSAWTLGPQGLMTLHGSRWTAQAAPALRGAVAAQPYGQGEALVLLPDRLAVFDFANGGVTVVWQGHDSPLGGFTGMTGDLGAGLWIAGRNGVGRLRRPNGRPEGPPEWLEFHPEGLDDFRDLATGPAGVAFATASAGPAREAPYAILHFDGRQWEVLRWTKDLDGRAWPGFDGSIWMKDGSSLYWRRGDRWEKIQRQGVLSGDFRDVSTAPGYVFWVATNDGLARAAPQLWRTPPEAPEMDAPAFAVERDGNGGLWFATTDSLIHQQAGRWQSYHKPPQYLPFVAGPSSLMVFRDGSVAARCGTGKIVKLDPRQGRFSEVELPPGQRAEGVVASENGTAWVTMRPNKQSPYDLFLYDGREFRLQFRLGAEWSGGEVRAIERASDGSFWLGGLKGLAVYGAGRLRMIRREEGYSDTGAFSIREVRPGRIWVGGRSKLLEYANHAWSELRTVDRARMITPARDGSVWVPASDGVHRYRNGAWLEYASDDGLPSSIAFAVEEDSEGGIWAATTLGISLFHPDADPDPPTTFIPEQDNLRQTPPGGEVKLTFRAVDKWKYTSSDRLLYSERLDDGPWSAFATGTSVAYRRLPAGAHRFQVRSMDRNGNIDPAPPSFEFKVLAPWYAEGGFLAVLGIAVLTIAGLLLTAAAQYRNRGKLIERLREANESRTRFFANMSHEIRTPMNGIIGMTELALETELTGDQHSYLKSVKQCAEALLGILNDLLDFSRLGAGKLQIVAAEFGLRDSVWDALQPVSVQASRKDIELVLEVAPEVPGVLIGDAGRLRQIVINLVGNAVKFTSEGEVVVRVAVEETGERDVVLRFSVCDTGIGIPPESQQRIFAPFEQADGAMSRRFGGTGLGLAISARLVEMMGGRIWVESPWQRSGSPGGPGSAFHCTVRFGLPSGKKDPAGVPPAGLAGVPVLIVEGNATVRSQLAETLARYGTKPIAAENGARAMAALEEADCAGSPLRLAIVDARLPDTDGLDLVESIRRHPAGKDLRIVMLSSQTRRPAPARCRQLVVDECVLKPIEPASLAGVLSEVLSGARMQPAKPAALPAAQLGLRVLVAEDNPVNQQVALHLLRKRGCSVALASDGKQALAAIERETFDVVLMDLQMPEMDGLEATTAIRAREAVSGGHLPILALTAHAQSGDRDKCLSAGMDGYISKPIQPGELAEALERVAGQDAVLRT